MKSNVVTSIEAPFYVNPLTQLWRTLEDSHILKVFKIFENFQIGKDCNDANLGVSGRWTNIFHLIFHEVKIEELLQWTFAHNCWDVFPNFFHFEHLPIWCVLWWLEGGKTLVGFEVDYNGNGLGPSWWWQFLAKVGWFFAKEFTTLGLSLKLKMWLPYSGAPLKVHLFNS